jgi:CSLREA domain-containing protein
MVHLHVVAILAVVLAVAPMGVWAATFNVTKTADTNDGACNADCSLREAIIAANNSSGADDVVVPAGIYVLTLNGDDDLSATGDLDVIGDLTLTGAGADATVLDGNHTDRVVEIHSGTVTIETLTIRNGFNQFLAGGIFNKGTLEVRDVLITGNRGDLNGGGGISSFGPLTIASSSIVSNRAGNQGGGVDANAAIVVRDSTISSNVAFQGGAIASSVDLDLEGSTISGNRANDSGGGVWNSGQLAARNVTISGNTPNGLYNVAPGAFASLNGVTIAGNTGRGIFVVSNSPPVALSNSIVATNTSANCNGAINSLGYNLDDDGTCSFVAPGDQSNVADAALTPLGLNGAPHATHALCTAAGVPHVACPAASPALEAGNPALPGSGGGACEATDQRGVTRPQGTGCDIGAYESRCPGGVPELCTDDGSFCGDGAVSAAFGEECDDAAANGTGASCCSAICLVRPDGSACEEGNVCTRPDTCQGGVCIIGPCGSGACSICGGTCTDAGGPCECVF